MLEKQTFGYTASCDDCSHSDDYDETETFYEAVQHMKGDGWRIRRENDGTWHHTCPSCVDDEVKDLR